MTTASPLMSRIWSILDFRSIREIQIPLCVCFCFPIDCEIDSALQHYADLCCMGMFGEIHVFFKFHEYEKDVDLPEHSHAAQIGIVLEGRIDLTIGGKTKTYTKGDRYFIEENVPHSGKIYAGYADVTFFNEPDRYFRKHRR